MTDTRAATGDRTEYLFKFRHGYVQIDSGPRGADERYFREYAYFEGKGVTAIRRLMEEHASMRKFFDNVRKLAELDAHGRLIGFVGIRDCDDEQEAAFEAVSDVLLEVAEQEDLDG